MKKPGYYSSGEFARMSQVTLRTVRYYDKQNILKPSYVNASGARFYSEEDFVRLQQILLLKYLGFSLDEIKEMTVKDVDYDFMVNSLNLQLKLVRDRMEQLQLVEQSIMDATAVMKEKKSIDWSQMLKLIHLTNMEKSLKNQYQNASNISARIHLHSLYSKNKQGWFPWIFEQCNLSNLMQNEDYIEVLELGAGNGALWVENYSKLSNNLKITLSDISEGMLRDARREIGVEDQRFDYQTFDCSEIPYKEHRFDCVLANHVLFYCEDIGKVLKEVKRVLKPNGVFICSTYGDKHMKEVNDLVHEFDERIVLSAEHLYKRFGLKNGYEILSPFFHDINLRSYPDSLNVTDADALVNYILSCHGNQNQFLLNRYKEFRTFVSKKTDYGYHITKEAGVFICKL